MNDINDIHPGKLQRKTRKTNTPSVVDMPATTSQPSTGNLLGDVLFDADSTVTGSLLDLTESATSSEPIPEVTLKPAQPESKAPTSPLDQLKAPQTQDSPSSDTDAAPVESIAPHRLQKKAPKTKASQPAEAPSTNLDKLEEILAQTRENNQKCLETLSKLQTTNELNQRKYALSLTIAFAILAILTVIGVIFGVSLRNNAKSSDIKYKQETYESALQSQSILQDENDKNRAGADAAFEVYQKIEQGLYEDAVEQFLEIRNKLTHPAETALLEAKIDEIRWKLAENAYHDGVMLYNSQNYEQARDAFVKSQAYKEYTAYSPRLNFYLAMSYYLVGDFEGARNTFSKLNPSDLTPDMDALARYYRAYAAAKTNNESEAYEYFDSFLKKYRYHKFADDATKQRAKYESARKQ